MRTLHVRPIAALLVARYRLARARRPELARARPWYAAEGERIRAIAAELGIDGRRATDAAAALSPAGRWDDVVARLPAFLRAHRDGAELPPMPTYSRNVRAACAILRGEGAPSGPKVSRFARNLAGDPSCVTVDRWAARAAGLPEHGGGPWYPCPCSGSIHTFRNTSEISESVTRVPFALSPVVLGDPGVTQSYPRISGLSS